MDKIIKKGSGTINHLPFRLKNQVLPKFDDEI